MARKSKKTKDEELLNLVDRELSMSIGYDSSELSEQRAKAMEYYLGEPYGNEQEGQSQVRTREVLDTIEWIKPELMKIFASGGDTVRFEPQTPQDVPWAEQATDYINYILNRKNPGFKIIYQWITDGLLQKNGIVKAWWDDTVQKTREEYMGLSDAEVQMLVAPEEVEIVEQENENGTWEVAILRSGPPIGIQIENVPPEEFLISRGSKCIHSAPFVAHRTQKSISDIRALGYDIPDDISDFGDGASAVYSTERQARYSNDDTDMMSADGDYTDPTMRLVWYVEAYVRSDYNNDGVAELRKVCKVGNTLLDNEEVDCSPFCSWTPIIISHKWAGLSFADLVMDLQLIQSQLMRNILNNQYLTNNGRYAVIEGMANMDDLLTSRAHGVVRQKMAGAVTRLDTPQLGNSAFQMLEYMDSLREKRTGVSERSQGLDPNALGANQAASAVNQVMTAAQQRIELVARVFAETGLTDLFKLLYKLVIQNDTRKSIFRLRDTYVEVNPSEWKEQADTSVVVGLGNGSRESEMMQMSQIFQVQQQLAANPRFAPIVGSSNVYNTVEDMVKVFNKASAGRYFTDPQSPQAQKAAQDAAQGQQQEAEFQKQLAQQEVQAKASKAQTDQIKAQTDSQYKDRMASVAEQKSRQDSLEHKDEVALKTAELEMEYTLEKEQGRGVSLGDS